MEASSYFLNRRTIRAYTDRQISESELHSILDEAAHAPNTGNMQLYSVIVTRSAEMKAKLAPCHFNQPSVTGCDTLLTFCADFNRFTRWCEVGNAHPGYGNLQAFTTAFLDTAIFAQQVCTVAEMRGLGSCFLGTTTYNADKIAHILNLPRLVVPVTTLTLGYPAESGSDSGRLPVNALIHHETYHNYTDEDIKSAYAEKESRPDSRQFVAENRKETLAQVFTDVRYTPADFALFSKIYKDFIEGQGYKL